jgi:hypothetical protein
MLSETEDFSVQPSRRPKIFTRLGRAAGQIEKETLKSEDQNAAKIGMDSHL